MKILYNAIAEDTQKKLINEIKIVTINSETKSKKNRIINISNKYESKINEIKNDKIRNSLTEL